MENKKLIAQIVLRKGKTIQDLEDKRIIYDGNAVKLAQHYEKKGADALIIYNVSKEEREKENAVRIVREIGMNVDIPIIAGAIDTAEDAKKLLLAGCSKVFISVNSETDLQTLETLSKRFGKERLAVCIMDFSNISSIKGYLSVFEDCVSLALMFGDNFHLYDVINRLPIETIPVLSVFYLEHVLAFLRLKNVAGISGKAFSDPSTNLFELRNSFARRGVRLQSCISDFQWDDLKTNADGLVPVIVQDYKNEQVLMMAYMNREAYETTLMTGRMTYFSRSRQKLWLKGETSGHFQYVKQILIDCDNDTLLAKVAQKGAACHTGNRTCFYRELVKKRYEDSNPFAVFETVMTGIRGQKENPVEGTYVDRAFDQEMDQILQKTGTSFVSLMLAAKNRDKENVRSQISDHLFQMMMIMDQLGISWSDIVREYKKL